MARGLHPERGREHVVEHRSGGVRGAECAEHDRDRVERFLDEGSRRGLTIPGLFGVFYYRSANPKTLKALGSFLPVPADALTREFAAGATPDEVCARSIRALTGAGARHFYISNLPIGRAATTLHRIIALSQTEATERPRA